MKTTKKKNRIDWLTIALGLAGSKADGSVDCRAAGAWLGVDPSTVRRWLRSGPSLAGAERISHAAGVPRDLIAPNFPLPRFTNRFRTD